MRIFFILGAASLMLMSAVTLPSWAAEQSATTLTVPVKQVDVTKAKLTVEFPPPIGLRTLTIDAPNNLAGIQSGDTANVEIDQGDNPQHVKKLISIIRAVDWQYRLIAIVAGFVLVLGVASLLTGWTPTRFVLGLDGRYSNSKVQLSLWFGAVMTVYLASLILRVWVWGWDSLGGVGIPEHLLELTGFSALTFGGAKAITVQKVENANKEAPAKAADAVAAATQATGATAAAAAAAADPATPPALVAAHTAAAAAAVNAAHKSAADAMSAATVKQAGKPNLLTDLVQNDEGAADIGDFQMIFIALVAVVTFMLAGFHFLGAIASGAMELPEVDTTLLSTFGIGQGAYLIKKLASPPGKG